MSTSPNIRPLQASDRPLLADVLSSDGTFTQDEIDVALELIDDALTKPESDYWFRIAASDGARSSDDTGKSTEQAELIDGYICYGPTPMTAATYDLYWIVTHQRARGRGVATQLIKAMEADLVARGVTGIRVETSVKESHQAARRLYAALEYPICAQFPDFYDTGDDLIVYFKRFAGSRT